MIELKCVWKGYKKGTFFSKDFVEVLKCVSLNVNKGEHVGIIGESGAGKSTLSRIITLLELPDRGEVFLDNEKITKKNVKTKRGEVGMVFQDPSTSLDPKMTILSTLKEASKDREEIEAVFDKVGLKKVLLKKYPHELSGGEQQRVAIARVLLAKSRYVVFDEFTSALDVPTQARIVNLLCNINENRDYGFIFVSHDVKLVNFLSDRIYVLYKGEIVEETDDLKYAIHPYTRMLLSGEVVETENKRSEGCDFYSACPYRFERCKREKPDIKMIGKNKGVRCFLYD